jgi:hypothetical protein
MRLVDVWQQSAARLSAYIAGAMPSLPDHEQARQATAP